MIKFDKDVLNTLKALEKEGFETYAAGECVRRQMMGEQVYDWDLITRADLSKLQELFPQGKVISKNKQIFRIDFTFEVAAKNDEPAYLDGSIVDIKCFDGRIEDELAERIFTIDAFADNPDRGFIDPFGGKDDMKAKLIRTVSDPETAFEKKPLAMLSAIRLAAETGYDLHKPLYEATGNWKLLLNQMENGNPAPVRDELERLLVSPNTGKGLKMLIGTKVLAAVLGEEVSSAMTREDKKSFNTLCENIDKTRPVGLRRLGLFYTTMAKKRAIPAIRRLQFDTETETHLIDAAEKLIDINFLNTDAEFKRFVFEMGMDRYLYLHELAKATRIVYDQPTQKVEGRNYMLKQLQVTKDPVFVEDLVIDANDLMEAGIAATPERAEELLNLVVAIVHKNPVNNQRDVLLKYAKKYGKSKFAAHTRYVNWTR